MTRTFALLLLTGIIGLSAGCASRGERRLFCCHKDTPPPKTVYVPPGAPVPMASPARTPAFVAPAPAPTFGAPGGAPPGGAFPMVPSPPPPPSITPTPPGAGQSNFEPNWKPTEAREPMRDSSIQLYAPETDKEPPVAKKPTIQSSVSPIPRFGVAKEGVYAGLHPTRAGFDWLQAKGVKTIVQVRLFGEDDSQDRKDVEARGMRYVAFEVSPVVLTKEKADEFNKLIRESANPGVFVYDADGSLAGGMWYLYLRWAETFDDDASQLRARSLGLDLNRDGQHRDMWIAVQKVLSDANR